MKQNFTLTVSSLISLVLFMLHVTEDTLHTKDGMALSGIVIIVGIMLVLLYGIVELAGRRSGYTITLLGGLAAAYMPLLHGMGPGATKWGFLFIWALYALGVSGSFTAIISAQALWRSFRARSPSLQG